MKIPTGNVTFLFTDIEGSTKLAQDFPDKLQPALHMHHEILQQAIESNNGFVFEIVGDAFCCSFEEAGDAVKAAVDARTDDSFVIMARTDALAVEGLNSALDRAAACVEAGADMVFPEAITELEMYKLFAERVNAPILANITEFGATPLFTVDELRTANVGLVLYPLSAFRAMNKAAENVYNAVRRDGTQKNVIDTMQTRMELYDRINYHAFEQSLDALFAQKKS